MEGSKDIPQPIKVAYGNFFELGAEAQDLALPLIEEAVIERGRNFPEGRLTTESAKNEAENNWRKYLQKLGDKLATQLDPSYWPGHGSNTDPVVRTRVSFLRIFEDQNAESLLKTKELIEKTLGK